MPLASEGEVRGDGAPTGAGPFLDAARLSPHSRLSARRPGHACAVRDFVWRRSHPGAGPRFASMRLELRMASASSWQGSVVTPGGAPSPPGCKLAKLARGRRTSLHSHDASRERPSVSEVEWGICFYSYAVKGVRRRFRRRPMSVLISCPGRSAACNGALQNRDPSLCVRRNGSRPCGAPLRLRYALHRVRDTRPEHG